MRKLLLSIFALSLLFASATALGYKVGQVCEVKWKGEWYLAKVLEHKGALYRVHYLGWGSNWDEWISAARMRHDLYKVDDHVMILWKGKYFPGKILKVLDFKYYIHYKGYDNSWNEWVGPQRIKKSL